MKWISMSITIFVSYDHKNKITEVKRLVACAFWNGYAASLMHAPPSVNTHQLHLEHGAASQDSESRRTDEVPL